VVASLIDMFLYVLFFVAAKAQEGGEEEEEEEDIESDIDQGSY
jgi:hypothetical protein